MADRYYLSREKAKKLKEAYYKADGICSTHATTPNDVRNALHELLSHINDNIFSTPIPEGAEDAADKLENELDQSYIVGHGM